MCETAAWAESILIQLLFQIYLLYQSEIIISPNLDSSFFFLLFGLNYKSLNMALPKQLVVKETLRELKSLLKKATPLIAPRLRALIEIKNNEKTGISKRDLAKLVGVDPNSIQTWRTLYSKGGIKAIQKHGKTGNRPSVFSKEEHQAIEVKLKNPTNGLRGYAELLTWVEHEFKKQVKYNPLMNYSIKNFGSKIKVARKSHINKDIEAVATFKKTLAKSVSKPEKQKKSSKK